MPGPMEIEAPGICGALYRWGWILFGIARSSRGHLSSSVAKRYGIRTQITNVSVWGQHCVYRVDQQCDWWPRTSEAHQHPEALCAWRGTARHLRLHRVSTTDHLGMCSPRVSSRNSMLRWQLRVLLGFSDARGRDVGPHEGKRDSQRK